MTMRTPVRNNRRMSGSDIPEKELRAQVPRALRTEMEENYMARIAGVDLPREKRIEIGTNLCRKFTDDEAYIEHEVKNALPRAVCLELTPEHMTGKLVNES